METDISRESGSGIRCTAIRLLLVALACAEWVAAWIVVYRSQLGM
jgi:hypothetical protein